MLAVFLALQIDPAKQVGVLVNEAVPESLAIGQYYAERRGIPASNILRVRTSAAEIVTWKTFREDVLGPFQEFLRDRPDVLYFAVVYGVPVKTSEENPANDAPAEDTVSKFVTNRDYAAVDRELELARIDHEIEGWVRNPLYGRDAPATAADKLVLVSRLDGPTAESARALVDHALYGEAFGIEGTHHLDTRGLKEGGHFELDVAMRRIARVFEAAGLAIEHEQTDEVVDLSSMKDLAHYWGWYTGSIKAENPFVFRRGAVGAHLHSFAAGELRSAVRTWTGPLVAHGITGTCGTVYEPLGAGFPDGALFFERFLAGHTFAESMTYANQFTSWMAVFVGDPLYAPYSKALRQKENRERVEKARAELERALDAGEPYDTAALADLVDRLAPDEPLVFLMREARARVGVKSSGTIAQLRAALADGDFAKALRLSPGNFEANVGAGKLKNLEHARALEPRCSEVRVLLARSYLQARKLDEARTEAEAAFPPPYALLGEIQIAQKKYDEAIERLRKAYASDRSVGVELGRAYLAIEKPQEAAEVLEAALADLPEPAQIEEIYELLDKATGKYKVVRQEWKLGRVSRQEAARIGSSIDRWATPGAWPGQDAYPDAVEGIPRLVLANTSSEPVEILIHGPTSRSIKLPAYRGSGPEPVTEWPVWPGVYRVAVVIGGKAQMGEQRVEAGRAYPLAINADGKPYRPKRP